MGSLTKIGHYCMMKLPLLFYYKSSESAGLVAIVVAYVAGGFVRLEAEIVQEPNLMRKKHGSGLDAQ